MGNLKYFSYFLTKIYFVGIEKNRLDETVLIEHQKQMLQVMHKKTHSLFISIDLCPGISDTVESQIRRRKTRRGQVLHCLLT